MIFDYYSHYLRCSHCATNPTPPTPFSDLHLCAHTISYPHPMHVIRQWRQVSHLFLVRSLLTPRHFFPSLVSLHFPARRKGRTAHRNTNDILRVLLIHANLPPPFLVEALHTATYILNWQPPLAINFATPYFLLLAHHPTYDHMCVFVCLCFPNTSTTSPHKLAPPPLGVFSSVIPSTKAIAYRCLDLTTRTCGRKTPAI